MMRRMRSGLVLVAAAMFVGLALGGCADNGAGRHSYRGAKGGFSIVFPQGWAVKEEAGAVTATGPPEGPADVCQETVRVELDDLPQVEPVQKAAADWAAALAKKRAKFQTDEEGDATLRGKAARRLVFSYQADQVTLKAVAWVVVDGRRVCTVTCTTQPGRFAQFQPRFDKVAESLRIE